MNIATIAAHLCWDDKPLTRSLSRAAGAGALTAVLTLLLSYLLFALLGRPNMGGLAGGAIFDSGWIPTFFAAVIWAPLWETLIGQMIPVAVLTSCGARPLTAILVSAILFSAGHVASGGGIGQGVVTLIAGLCFSSIFAANLQRGFVPAYGLTATAHATNNALALLLSFGFGL